MNIFKTTTWLLSIIFMLCVQIVIPVFVYAQKGVDAADVVTENIEVDVRIMCKKKDTEHFIETWQNLKPFSSSSPAFKDSITTPTIGSFTAANITPVTTFLADKDFFTHILITFPAERRLKRAYREGLHAGQNAANPSIVSLSKIDIYKEDRCTNFILSYLKQYGKKNNNNLKYPSLYERSDGKNIYPEVLLYYFRKGFYESFEGLNNRKEIDNLTKSQQGFQKHSFTDIYDPKLHMEIDFSNIQQDQFRLAIYDDSHIHDVRRGTLSLQFITYEYRAYGDYFIEIPRILPPIEFRIDDEEEGPNGFSSLADLDVVNIYRSDTVLDEIKLLNDPSKNANTIVRILEGSVEFRGITDEQNVGTTSSFGTVTEVNRTEIYATDKKADRIIVDSFRQQLVADGEEYDGRGGGVKALEKGKFRGLVETDSSDELFKGIINFFLSFVGAIAVLMLVFAGFMFITDGGSSSQSEKALKTIQNTVIGIIVIISSYTIVNTVLDFNGNARDQVRIDIKMGSSTLLGATLARGGCMYTGATAGVVRLCNENGLLILKVQSLNINTFWPLEEVRGTCRKASIFTICIEDEY